MPERFIAWVDGHPPTPAPLDLADAVAWCARVDGTVHIAKANEPTRPVATRRDNRWSGEERYAGAAEAIERPVTYWIERAVIGTPGWYPVTEPERNRLRLQRVIKEQRANNPGFAYRLRQNDPKAGATTTVG